MRSANQSCTTTGWRSFHQLPSREAIRHGNKPKAVFISSLVFLVVICAFCLSTYLPRNTEDGLLRQRKSDVNALTVPQSDTTGITSFSYSLDAASKISEIDDVHINSQSDPEDVQISQHSENLTEADILMLIADLEKQRAELLQEEEEKSRLAFKLRNEDDTLIQAYEMERDLAQEHHDAVEADFEREVLGGRSVHDVVTAASDDELEEFRAHPLSQTLTDACLHLQEIIDTFTAHHHANVDRMNSLMAEGSELHLRSVEIEKDIDELKAMLE